MMNTKKGLASKVNKFFIYKTGSGMNVNEMLAQESPKPVIKKIQKPKSKIKIYARFIFL